MSRRNLIFTGAGVLLTVILVLQIPAINSRLAWRYEVAKTYAKNVLNPVGAVPTAIPNPTSTQSPATPTAPVAPTTAVVAATVPATPTLAPPPPQAFLSSPPYEKQNPNNCGPAALSMLLKYYGWTGDQATISDVIKPVNGDRNVNPEEMAYWIRNFAGWLRIEYRVGGDLETLKRFIAAGYPVIIEGTTSLNPDDTGWPDDDLWAAHYLLLNGYDDTAQTFTAQDPYRGPEKIIPYMQLASGWKPFNYLYMVLYLPGQEEQIKSLLASDWDPDVNRQKALDVAQAATVTDPSDAFA